MATLKDAMAVGRFIMKVHDHVQKALREREKKTKEIAQNNPSDKVLRAALKNMGYRPDEIDFALKSTSDKQNEPDAVRIKAAIVILHQRSTKAKVSA